MRQVLEILSTCSAASQPDNREGNYAEGPHPPALSLFICLLLLLLFLPAFARAQDPLNPMFMPAIDQNPADYPSNIWITGPLAKVRQDSGSPETVHWALVYGTQNEFQGFQVHVQAPASGIANLSVTMSDLVNSRAAATISASSTDIIVYREAYVHVTQATSTAATYYNSTGYYPDILIPAVDPYFKQITSAFPFSVSANQNQSVWVDVHIPASAPSGYYSGQVTVKSGATVLATMPVVYAVWQWPSLQGGKMPSTSSLSSWVGIDVYGGFCQQTYGGSGGSNCGSYPGAGGDANTAVTFTQIDGTVELLDHRFSNGYVSNIYPQSGSFSAYDAAYGPLLNGTPAHVTGILSGAKLTSMSIACVGTCENFPTDNSVFQNFETNFASQGWTPVLLNYLCDEPPNGCTWPTLASTGSAERSASSPVIPNLVTTNIANSTANGVQDVIDIMVPIINDLDPQGGSLQRSAYNTWLAGSSGPTRQLWSYQSCESADTCTNGVTGDSFATWPNYHIDGRPVANRAMEWLTFLHNQSGELYYAADVCTSWAAIDGCINTAAPYYAGGWGDGTLIYPCSPSTCGTTTPLWLPSLRLKIIRDGMQDYEYLLALTNFGKGSLVQQQINSWVTNSYTFSVDPTQLTAARQALGNALHQLSYSSVLPPTNLQITVR